MNSFQLPLFTTLVRRLVVIRPRPASFVRPTNQPARDAKYSSNTAQYLLDLDSEAATFDFCGGMLFQLVLSDRLKSHLQSVALEKDGEDQPVIHQHLNLSCRPKSGP